MAKQRRKKGKKKKVIIHLIRNFNFCLCGVAQHRVNRTTQPTAGNIALLDNARVCHKCKHIYEILRSAQNDKKGKVK